MPTGDVSYWRTIVETVREPLLVLDTECRVISASRAFYRTFSVSPAQTLHQCLFDLGSGQWDIPVLRTLLEGILRKNTVFDDFEVAHDFPTIGRKVMLLNGRRLCPAAGYAEHVLLAIEDVTEKKRLSDELVRSNEDLQRFAYVAAHDLRSPLNNGLSFLDVVAHRLKGVLDEENTRYLTMAEASFRRLGRLMDDILAYSAAENAPQRNATISLSGPLGIALANLQHHIDAAGATITVEELPTVGTDRTQMVLVFQNLIGNAIKYRSADAPVIRIGAVLTEGYWRVSIEDNGQGFSGEHARVIFEPFRRLHGASTPGSGIGLATCKRVVERSGGTIWAESEPGKGSAFFFTIPS
jgi:signal transduction histidine kinase